MQASNEQPHAAPETVPVNDITMAYNVYGETDPPLVMVHGITGARHDFRLVVDALAAERRVVVVDQRGHGETSNPADPATYTFDQLVDDLAGFIDAIIEGPFDLLGHSMGGMVCMRYAASRPDRLRSLVLMGTAGESPKMPFDLEEDFIDQLFATAEQQGLGAAREMNDAIEGPERKLVDEIHGPAFFGDDEEWRYRNLDLYAVSRLGPVTFRHESVLEEVRSINVPTTVIVGELDTAFFGPSERLAEAIPNAELHVIDGAYHSPQHSHTQTWLDLIEQHFARVE